ncbi:MAG: ATP-binding cassette domain-containing protein [Clostridia bacterium]|jgi:ABC-2 type transport system ATP-binding protein|uniref:ATP-binding cassette domain-containing protein n=1 Tax=Candidatus Merdicola sp. TaxID=3085652 RepID=UPI002EBCAA38|nr:ATP-binding cassette domain-containing protein [Clostridia bacterium]
MEYILETENINKKYGQFNALNNLNMHIPKGAIYGLIGKNGAGKTTLIRIICGLQKVTSGKYTIYGISDNSRKIVEARKRLGGIVETPSICLDMTAEDNLKEQYKIIGLPSYDNLEEILKLVKLNDTGKKTAKHFSLGMKQRLGLAIALVGNPDLLILDEPINGLDPEGIIEIRELILRLNKEKGITFLISSHYLDELSKIATFYGIIDKGRIIKEIDKNELEQNFRKRTQITITNLKECVKYLEEKRLSYKVISDNTIDIYEKINVSELVIELSKRNCTVNDYQEKGESLENYYLNLIGGASND